MLSKTHISTQKPRGRQLNAKVCGSESAIFLILLSFLLSIAYITIVLALHAPPLNNDVILAFILLLVVALTSNRPMVERICKVYVQIYVGIAGKTHHAPPSASIFSQNLYDCRTDLDQNGEFESRTFYHMWSTGS